MDVIVLVISIFSLAGTLFAIGYEPGKDIHDRNDNDKTQK